MTIFGVLAVSFVILFIVGIIVMTLRVSDGGRAQPITAFGFDDDGFDDGFGDAYVLRPVMPVFREPEVEPEPGEAGNTARSEGFRGFSSSDWGLANNTALLTDINLSWQKMMEQQMQNHRRLGMQQLVQQRTVITDAAGTGGSGSVTTTTGGGVDWG